MSQEVYNMPLHIAIRKFTTAQLVQAFRHTHPAFLAAIVKEAARLKS